METYTSSIEAELSTLQQDNDSLNQKVISLISCTMHLSSSYLLLLGGKLMLKLVQFKSLSREALNPVSACKMSRLGLTEASVN